MKRGLGHKIPPGRQTAPTTHQPADHVPSRPDQRAVLRTLNPAIPYSICVTGSRSNAGKTWLCEQLIAALHAASRPVAALKVTRTHVATCPRENDHCTVCDDLSDPYELIADRERLDVPRKDTGRYLAAGADCVRWLIVQPTDLPLGAAAAVAAIPSGLLLVAEGNSFRDFVTPDLTLMLLDADCAPKASALPLLPRTDAFIAPADVLANHRARLADRVSPAAVWLSTDDAVAWVMDRLPPRAD